MRGFMGGPPETSRFFINFYLLENVIFGMKIGTKIQKGRLSSSVFCDQNPFLLAAKLLLLLIRPTS